MNKFLYVLLLVFFSFSFFAFGWLSHTAYMPGKRIKQLTTLDKIKRKKVLNVTLLNASTSYYTDSTGESGFEYDLISSYAKHLGVALKVNTVHTVSEALALSKSSDVDITSASITKTPKREEQYNFAPSYFEVQEQVVCNRSMKKKSTFPQDVEDLANLKIIVGSGTSYIETIEALKSDGFELNVEYGEDLSSEEILDKVAKHEIDCTIVDSNIYALNLRYFPEISMAFTISKHQPLAWVIPTGAAELKADMYSWLNTYEQQGKMIQLKDHYYSYVRFFDYYSTTMFYKRIETRLPKYEKYFKEAGTRFGVPWTLLASISYQESHWNAKARSFTGVRGLMMLTLKTARLLNVKNRRDPKQSIIGGTRHIKQMIKFVSKDVKGENRLKFALAAYNIGMGHIRDAQVLATRMGYDKNEWSDLKIVLPLLSQKKYYYGLTFGYARGSEPVKYVEAIYNYRHILENKISRQ